MTEDRASVEAALTDDEIAALDLEALPDRKAMSTIGCDPSEFAAVAGGELIPPPDDGAEQPASLEPGQGAAYAAGE